MLYARTVFDPLTIIASDGSVQPYLAQAITPNSDYTVWTITARPNVRFHDGTPVRRRGHRREPEPLQGQPARSDASPPSAPSRRPSSSTVTVTLKQPWVPFPAYLAGGIGGQPGYIVAPSMIANPKGSEQPIGTGPFKFKEWVPNDHFTADRNTDYWRSGPALSRLGHLPAHHRRPAAGQRPAGRQHRHHAHGPAREHPELQGQHQLRVHRRQRAHRGRARHELHHVQPLGPRHERHPRPPGHGHGHQLQAVLTGRRQGRQHTDQPALRPQHPVLRGRRRIPGLQPEQGTGAGQAARDRNRQGRGVHAPVHQLGATRSRWCSSSRTSSRRWA